MAPFPTNESLSIIAVGNPGCGKSTTLNYLARELLFKAGVKIGEGMTYQLDEKKVFLKKGEHQGYITFCDTPGLDDFEKRQSAGKAITEALRKGGKTKVIFFVGQDSGRPKQADVTTMRLVLQACPELGKSYGVLLPKINAKMAKRFTKKSENPDEKDNWATYIAQVFKALGDGMESRECFVGNIQGIQKNEDLEEEDDKLVEWGELKTLDNRSLEDFVFGELPSIRLTIGQAGNVDTTQFDELQSQVAKLIAQAEFDKKKMADLKEKVRELEARPRGNCTLL